VGREKNLNSEGYTMTAPSLVPHEAADALRTVAQLIDDGLPVPIGITPLYADGLYPTRVQVDPSDVDQWLSALDLPPMVWAVRGAVGQEHGVSEDGTFALVACRPVELRVVS
jgi:hypothetical protein